MVIGCFARRVCVVVFALFCSELHAFNMRDGRRSLITGQANLTAVLADGVLGDGVLGDALGVVQEYRFMLMGCMVFALMCMAMTPVPAVFVLAGWAYASISMSLLNKQATMIFPFTCLLVVLQMAITDVTLIIFEGSVLKCGKWSDLLKWSVVPVFYTGVLASGIWALSVTTVSTVMVLRNILPVFALVAEKLFLDRSNPITLQIILSMAVVIAGSVIYAFQNVSVSHHTVGIILLNCILVVSDRLVQRSLLSSPDFSLSPTLCMLINNTMGIVLMVVLAVTTAELWTWPEAVAAADRQAWFWIVLTGVNGCCLGYLGIRTQKLVSATSFLMFQNANKVVLILLSVVLFGDVMTGTPFFGCVVSMLGSLWYGVQCLPKESAATDGKHGVFGRPAHSGKS